MAKAVYQNSSGAVIFENTPEEIDIIKLKDKVKTLESKVEKLENLVVSLTDKNTKLETLVGKLSDQNDKMETRLEELKGLVESLPPESE